MRTCTLIIIPMFFLIPIDSTEAFLDKLFGKRKGHRERSGFYYQVKKGDSLYSLSRRFHLSVAKLKTANRIKGNILPLRRIYIPRSTFVVKPDPVYEEHPHPKPQLRQLANDNKIREENKTKIDKKKNKTSREKNYKKTNSVKFFWPIDQPKLLPQGGFGELNGETRNAGILLECDSIEVRPSRKGKLVFQGKLDGYGKTVILDHLDDYFTIYAHLSKIKRYKEGQWIPRTKSIGYTGKVVSTGESALHFEVRYLNQAMDPLIYLDRNELNNTTVDG